MNKKHLLVTVGMIVVAIALLAAHQPSIVEAAITAFTNTALAQTQNEERKAKVSSPNGLKPVPPDLQIPARGQQVSSIGTLLEGKSAPEHVTYNQVFRHLKELNKEADDEEKKGKDGKHLRKLYKHLAKLDDAQAVILDLVAADTNRDVERLNAKADKIIKKFREKHKGKLKPGDELPAPPDELMILSQERKQTVLRARDRLRYSIGEEAFAKFEKFVNERVTPNLYQLELKKQAPPQASSQRQNQEPSTEGLRRRTRDGRRKSEKPERGGMQSNFEQAPGDCYWDCYCDFGCYGGGCSVGYVYISSWTWHDGQNVYGYGATELDYCAGLYYDPAVYSRFVEGNYQSENFRLLADGYSEGYADWYPAEVGFRYNQPIGNEYYNTDSVHYVLDYYYGGRRVVARTAHTIRFPPPADQCQPGQSFAPNGNPCPTPTPTPTPSPTPTPTPQPVVNIEQRIIVPKKGEEIWHITVADNPNNTPITLSLTTTEGTGEAKFKTTTGSSATVQITQSFDVTVLGVTESSKTDNISLEAKANGTLLKNSSGSPSVDKLCVLWVTLVFRSSGTVSPDNEAASTYANAVGTSNLGLYYSRGTSRQFWRHGIEIVGTVAPSNFPFQIVLDREVVEFRLYEDNNPSPIATGKQPDRSDSLLRDDNPPKLYDLDFPGIPATAGPTGSVTNTGTKKRRRTNFRQYAFFGNKQVSDDLLWFQRLSVQKTGGEDALANDLPNDNIVGVGKTDLGLGASNTPTAPRSMTFVAQSVPTYMDAGYIYNVSVTLRNTGNDTWTQADLYRLGSQNPQDNYIWGMHRVELPTSVAPGGEVTFNYFVTSPYTPGTYNFQWRMVQDGVEWFGDLTPNVTVEVYQPYTCDPWQEQDCWNRGGSWDSSTCQCYGLY